VENIRAAVENRRSRAIPERLNFREEGTLRKSEWIGDRYLDNVVYSMLAVEWREKGFTAIRPRRTTGPRREPSRRQAPQRAGRR
jgi:hypothetical protein